MGDTRRSSSSVKPSTVAKLAPSDFQNKFAREMASEEIKENNLQFRQGAALREKGMRKEHKNFMSTTVSAASKKKILAEKNDPLPSECSGTYSVNDPEIKKTPPVYRHPDAAAHMASYPFGLYRSGEETVVSSESQPYDPLTNYLSPRPKYLRYDPNRRREIYLRRGREVKGTEGNSVSGFDRSLSFEVEGTSCEGAPSSPPASLKQEGLDAKSPQDRETHETMEEEEGGDAAKEEEWEEEEEEEEISSCCDLVWKSLLLFGVLFVSTFYISWVHPLSTVTSVGNFSFSIGNLFKIQDSFQEVAENIGINLDGHVATYTNACIQVHFDELTKWGSGISSNTLDDLPKYGNLEGEKLQYEENLESMWAEKVNSNSNLFMVEGKGDGSEKLQVETEIDYIPVMGQGEIKEPRDCSQAERAEDINLIDGEKRGSFDTVGAFDLKHENCFTGDVVDEHEDVIMKAEIDETDDVTVQLSKLAQSSQGHSVSDHEEEAMGTLPLEKRLSMEHVSIPHDISYVEDANALIFYRTKVFTTVLMVLTVAASAVIGFLRLWETKASDEVASSSFPNYGFATEGRSSSELAKIGEIVEKGFDFLANTDENKELHENHPPVVELLEEKFVGSFANYDKSKELYERNPPTVKLLGEFSVAAHGISNSNNDSYLRNKMIGADSLFQEMSTRKSLPSEEANQSSSVFLSAEPSPYRNHSQEEIGRKQNNPQKHEAVKGVSTPVRRSSRIRNRVTSPGE